jgi:hypothetical protein
MAPPTAARSAAIQGPSRLRRRSWRGVSITSVRGSGEPGACCRVRMTLTRNPPLRNSPGADKCGRPGAGPPAEGVRGVRPNLPRAPFASTMRERLIVSALKPGSTRGDGCSRARALLGGAGAAWEVRSRPVGDVGGAAAAMLRRSGARHMSGLDVSVRACGWTATLEPVSQRGVPLMPPGVRGRKRAPRAIKRARARPQEHCTLRHSTPEARASARRPAPDNSSLPSKLALPWRLDLLPPSKPRPSLAVRCCRPVRRMSITCPTPYSRTWW